MERDPLEQYIDTNRQSFDKALPEHDLWSRIAKELPKETPVVPIRRPRVYQLMRYAAAVLAIVSISVFSTMQYMKSSTPDVISAEVMTELYELTDYYDFEVTRKLTQLAAYGSDTEATEELADIDNIIEELKTELIDVPKGSEEKVINAMINNFQLKILILERILEAKENSSFTTEKKNNEVNI